MRLLPVKRLTLTITTKTTITEFSTTLLRTIKATKSKSVNNIFAIICVLAKIQWLPPVSPPLHFSTDIPASPLTSGQIFYAIFQLLMFFAVAIVSPHQLQRWRPMQDCLLLGFRHFQAGCSEIMLSYSNCCRGCSTCCCNCCNCVILWVRR